EPGGDRSRRGEGDLVLARAAAREDGHAETASQAHPMVVVVAGGGGGPGECWPIRIVTVEFFAADVPPSGFCDWTMPSSLGSLTETNCWLTWKPTLWRSATACCADSPTTLGIVTCGGPFETWRSTVVVPFGSEEFAAGFW